MNELIALLIAGLLLALVSLVLSRRQTRVKHTGGAVGNFVIYTLRLMLFLNWLVLPISLLLSLEAPMFFASGNDFLIWLDFLAVASFPITVIVAIMVARYFRKRGYERKALFIACLPLLHFAGYVFLAFFVF